MVFDSFIIHKITKKDDSVLYNFAIANEDRMRLFFPLMLAQNRTLPASKIFAEVKSKAFETDEEYLFTVKKEDNSQMIALVYIKELDWQKQQGELAYCIDYNWERKGLTTKVVSILSSYAFQKLNLKTLQIIVHKSNIASIRVAQKCHFVWQKKLINAYTPPGGTPMDMELYELYG
ncbi:MAG: GNAT family N-acetyltransferase [Flavobacteriaceae bacterium]|nr:MAG: GNAT family N-acetyltransferase [Flavobacteriaceae bacterium]